MNSLGPGQGGDEHDSEAPGTSVPDHEWETLKETLRVGDPVRGRIARHVAFGAFVDLGHPFDGLIENPNFSSDRVRNESRQPAVGSIVDAVVVQLDDRNHQVRLSIRPEDVRCPPEQR